MSPISPFGEIRVFSQQLSYFLKMFGLVTFRGDRDGVNDEDGIYEKLYCERVRNEHLYFGNRGTGEKGG